MLVLKLLRIALPAAAQAHADHVLAASRHRSPLLETVRVRLSDHVGSPNMGIGHMLILCCVCISNSCLRVNSAFLSLVAWESCMFQLHLSQLISLISLTLKDKVAET